MFKYRLSLIFIPLILLFFLMLDGVLAVYFISSLRDSDYQMAIQSYATVVFLLASYLGHHRILPIITVITLMYDAYYSPVMSFYTIPILLVYVAIQSIASKVKPSFLRNIAVVAIANILINFLVYIEAIILKFNRLDFMNYMYQKVIPTMLFNVVLFFIMSIPIIKWLKWLDKQLHILTISK